MDSQYHSMDKVLLFDSLSKEFLFLFIVNKCQRKLQNQHFVLLNLDLNPKQDLPSSPVPPLLQTIDQRFLSGSGFVVYDSSLKV